jgi:uncharacterized protein YecT (DUF1311 family)
VSAQIQAHTPLADDIDGHYERVIGEATGGGPKGISASHVDAWLVNAKGNPTYKPTHLKVTNLGSKPCFFWSRIAQKSNWKVEAGQEALFELPPAQTSAADRAAGRDVLDSIDFTVEYWVPGPRRSSSAAPAQSPSPVPTESSSPSKSSEQILKENDEWTRENLRKAAEPGSTAPPVSQTPSAEAAKSTASPEAQSQGRALQPHEVPSLHGRWETQRLKHYEPSRFSHGGITSFQEQDISLEGAQLRVSGRWGWIDTGYGQYSQDTQPLDFSVDLSQIDGQSIAQLPGSGKINRAEVRFQQAGGATRRLYFGQEEVAAEFAAALRSAVESQVSGSAPSTPLPESTVPATAAQSYATEETPQENFETEIAGAEDRLTNVYKKLRDKLTPAEKVALKREEMEWIKEKESLPEGSRGRYKSIYNRIRKLEQRASTSTSATSETGPTSRAPSYATEETSPGHFETEIAAAENELTEVYNRLRVKLTPAEKVALKREEIGWIKEKENLPEGSRGRLECINKRIRDLEQRVP